MNPFYILTPNQHALGLLSLLVVMMILAGVVYLIVPAEQAVVETISVNAVVVSQPEEITSRKKSTVSTPTKLRLPDGMHAYVFFNNTTPNLGDTIKVKVNVLEDGSRRVIAPDVW